MALHPTVHEFLELIGDPDSSLLTEEAVRSINEARASTGTFMMEPIVENAREAYEALEEIYASILGGTATAASLAPHYQRFYRSISMEDVCCDPIDTLLKVGKKLRLLECLCHGHDSVTRLDIAERCRGRNYMLEFYRNMECHLEPMDTDSSEYGLVERYLKNSSCCPRRKTLELVSVLRVEKPSLEARYSPFRRLDNRQILWHGSRLQNWPGILKEGLLIAPPGVQCNGSTFGKGLYFTDKVERARQYCASPTGVRGVLLLSEVALGESIGMAHSDDGKQYVRKDAGGRDKASKYHSCCGFGICSPDARGNVVDSEGAVWPVGQSVQDASRSARHHTEFVVFNPTQTRMRYVVVVERPH